MRVVVTGASGNLGTALLRLLTAEPQVTSVLGVVRRPPSKPRREPYSRAEWLACDLGASGAHEDLTAAFRGADAVVHLAWAIQPGRRQPPASASNVRGSRRVRRAVVSAGVPHLVALSSVAAYAPAPRGVRVDETWPMGGVRGSGYSRQKVALEHLLDAFESSGETTVTRLRPAAVASREAASEVTRYVFGPLYPPRLVARALPLLPLDPRLRMQIVHSADVAQAIWAAIERRAAGAYNLVAEPVIGPWDLARASGTRWLPLRVPGVRPMAWVLWRTGIQPAHPGWLALLAAAPLADARRAGEVLGWAPQHDAVAMLEELFAGMREGSGKPSPPLRPRAAFPVRVKELFTGRTATQG
jgi:UDP-glucose 4-epimerase